MKLAMNALIKYVCGLVLMGALLFVPAGTLAWGRGWLLMSLLFVPMLALGLVLFLKAPELLRKRLNSREGETAQKKVVGLAAMVFLLGFIAAGLDFRFGWTHVPGWIVAIASVLFLASYGMYAEVMRENAYLSRTVEVQAEQKVIDTGLYGIVRHPMYAASVLMFMSMPLVLGSWVSLLVFLVYPILIVMRIRNEEQVLLAGLEGYAAYREKVKYSLIPFIW
ncbi:MAG: isoprenylcysteine carboxylmethyltransferase family protein [Clostridia bacterium]|nr:isoprenylcysteine carboxylmethyltransferase family protein [Clostridia bacterium]